MREYRAGCTGKMVFLTRREARQWSHGTEKSAGKPQRAYRCSWCAYWHITTMRPDVAKRSRKIVREQARREGGVR